MDPQRFDELTRALAVRTPRRTVLRLLGVALGLGALVTRRDHAKACEEEWECVDGYEFCHEGYCVQCLNDDYCPGGDVCVDDFCQECREDAGCADGLRCDSGSCSNCRQHADCPDGQVCVSGICAECWDGELNCPEGQTCQNGSCVGDAIVLPPGLASLTVHQRLCGDQYRGGSPYDECHDVLVGGSYAFTIGGPVTATAATDVASGDVTFANLPAGTYEMSGGVPGEFVVKEILCSDTGTGQALAVTSAGGGVRLDVPAGAAVVCDVYEHPVDLRGDVPAPVVTPAAGQPVAPATALPQTGVGKLRPSRGKLPVLIGAVGAAAAGVALRLRGRP